MVSYVCIVPNTKKYTEIKNVIMAKLFHISEKQKHNLERTECPLSNGIQLSMSLTWMSEQQRLFSQGHKSAL